MRVQKPFQVKDTSEETAGVVAQRRHILSGVLSRVTHTRAAFRTQSSTCDMTVRMSQRRTTGEDLVNTRADVNKTRRQMLGLARKLKCMIVYLFYGEGQILCLKKFLSQPFLAATASIGADTRLDKLLITIHGAQAAMMSVSQLYLYACVWRCVSQR